MQPEHLPHLGSTSGLEIPEPSCSFNPAKHQLDRLPCIDRLGVDLMTGSAPINRRTPGSLGIMSHMGSNGADA